MNAPTRVTRISSRGSILRRRATCARPSAATGVFALECAMDELAAALKLDPLELRLRCYSDRDQNTDPPFSSKALRECYRQGAAAFGWASAIRDRARCGTAATLSAGAWPPASGSVTDAVRCADRSKRQRPCGSRVRDLRTLARAATPSWRRSRRTCLGCRSKTSASTRRLESPAIAGRRRIMDRGVRVQRDRDDSRGDPR